VNYNTLPEDFQEKGVSGALKDGMLDTADLLGYAFSSALSLMSEIVQAPTRVEPAVSVPSPVPSQVRDVTPTPKPPGNPDASGGGLAQIGVEELID